MTGTVETVDVVVVGAGPVGLLTAIELTLGGARALVLERLAAPSTAMKAGGIGPLGTEALQRRGMAAAFAIAEARSFAVIKSFTDRNGPDVRGKGSKFVGHFAGLSLLRKDAQREPDRRSHPVDQQSVEAMLADRAHALGVAVRRGCDVTGFVQQDDAVDVTWASPTGEGPPRDGHIRCAYLVGCDGGRSPIRTMAGFEFPGTPPTSTFYQALAELDHPERLSPGWHRTPGGVFSYGPLPGRLVMLDFSGPPADRDAPVTREEVDAVLRRITGVDVRVQRLDYASRWGDTTRLVDTYCRGRVLLAGDAAHVHTPFGGQGLSLGLVDAANLGWKLAAIVRGDIPEALLDSYTAERRPVAEAALATCQAQMAIMRPDPQSGAMRDLVAQLLDFDDVNRLLNEQMTGLSTRYAIGDDLGPACDDRDDVGRLIGDRPIGHGEGGTSLYALMQDGAGVLLDASPDGQGSALVSALGAARMSRVRCIAVDAGPSLLVRPDACIAWIGEADCTDGLADALGRWFEPPPTALDGGSPARVGP